MLLFRNCPKEPHSLFSAESVMSKVNVSPLPLCLIFAYLVLNAEKLPPSNFPSV